MEAFLTFIIVTIAIFYLLGMVGRWGLRYWIRRKQQEFGQQFGTGAYGNQSQANQQQREKERQREKRREGEVMVQQTQEQQKKVSNKVGDYVDFEEVDGEK